MPSWPPTPVRHACIDIGSNTTRLLVADLDGESLRPVHELRAFTRLGDELRDSDAISPAKLAQLGEVVAR
ncbi:MAG TPA: hypothetical protein VIM22_09605, partial [Solirubrobacteraceae bacterium]